MLIESEKALSLVVEKCGNLPHYSCSLNAAFGKFLAEDIFAPIDHPIFDQSAVDGYAIRFCDLETRDTLELISEIKAGDSGEELLKPGQCIRIFTGAPIPNAADTVVMQEYSHANGKTIRFFDEKLKFGGNVRKKAEQIQKGSIALRKGQLLNPAAIGFLASLGIQEVLVKQAPRVQIIVTGNEFADSWEELENGKIFESNGQMLQAAFAKQGIEVEYQTCLDDLDSLSEMVRTKSSDCDLLILTGGVSVGDYDFSLPALESNGYEVVFHKVNQKPGKPLLFAKKDDLLAFGLPGNPRAVMVSFYVYILPLLQKWANGGKQGLRKMLLPLSHDFGRNDDGKTHFVTAKFEENGLNMLQGQQSHMLQSLAEADVLVVLPASPLEYKKGAFLEVRWLD